MPFVKPTPPPKHAKGNRGSSKDIIDYLEKENDGKDNIAKEFFFSSDQDFVPASEAVQGIDNNRKGLKNNETKFYEVSVSFSEKEIQHLERISKNKADLDKNIKGYTRDVMDQYAKGFNREVNGKPLTGNDLVYYAKIERNRRYDGNTNDPTLRAQYKHNYRIRTQANDARLAGSTEKAEALEAKYIKNRDGQVILPGNIKDGKNTHVHVVVSRRDRSQSVSLSPMANSRGSKNKLNGKDVQIGFDRDKFKERSEAAFDNRFDYARDKSEYYKSLKEGKALKNGISKFGTLVKDPERYVSNLASSAIEKAFKRGITKQLIKANQPNIAKQIPAMPPKARKELKAEAKKALAKDLLKSAGSKAMTAALPVPASLAIKAVSSAFNLIKSKSKSQEMERS